MTTFFTASFCPIEALEEITLLITDCKLFVTTVDFSLISTGFTSASADGREDTVVTELGVEAGTAEVDTEVSNGLPFGTVRFKGLFMKGGPGKLSRPGKIGNVGGFDVDKKFGGRNGFCMTSWLGLAIFSNGNGWRTPALKHIVIRKIAIMFG